MNSPIPEECYDCHISARTRRQMLNMTEIDSLAKLQACLRQLCNKCQVWDNMATGLDRGVAYTPNGRLK